MMRMTDPLMRKNQPKRPGRAIASAPRTASRWNALAAVAAIFAAYAAVLIYA